MSTGWDLNCDLGEGESRARTASLMRWITSANIACGGHAGDIASMQACLRLAAKHGVRIGAHPGPWDRVHFGRRPVTLSPPELELLLLHQVGALERIARDTGVRLHHVKLHGGLYHAVEHSPALAVRFLKVMENRWPGMVVYGRAGGGVAATARRIKTVRVLEEAFVDRAYLRNGLLVPRDEADALIERSREALARVEDLCLRERVRTRDGSFLPMPGVATLCIHGDTPSAPSLARKVREWLQTFASRTS
jgi:UPF0271 protein